MNGNFTRKFRILSDPPVVGNPFKIDLDEDKCIGCGLCVQQCPCQTISLVERTYSEYQEPACQYNCPAGVDVRKYMSLLASGGSYNDAWEIITDSNPFPAITGLVCPHLCESGCNRQYLDDAVNINEVERFIGDWGIKKGLAFAALPEKSGKSIAVIGSGPSGMSCAYQLARLGHEVTIYEAEAEPGGMLRYAIPSYRLPKDIVQKEFSRILDLGVTLKLNMAVGENITFEELEKNYNAVYFAIGAQDAVSLGVNGEDDSGIINGLAFLKTVSEGKSPQIGKRVVVIGGGNVAIDAARTALRSGAVTVEMVALEGFKEMPAYEHEVNAAIEEGITFINGWGPNHITKNGAAIEIELKKCLKTVDAGGEFNPVYDSDILSNVKADSVIIAIGQKVDSAFINSSGITTGSGIFKTDPVTMQTSIKGIFAGGDAVTGPSTVTSAIGEGRKAALSINCYLSGREYSITEKKEISYRNVPITGYAKAERNYSEKPIFVESDNTFGMIEKGILNSDQVQKETERCFSCGKFKCEFTGSRSQYFEKICLACSNCEAICPHDALKFPNYYRVEKGRWSNAAFTIPGSGDGFPNPFMEEKPPQFSDIENKITDTERVIYRRRSTRVFSKEQVPREMIHRILEAGRFSPSAGNSQPWKFIVVRDRDLLDELNTECVKTLGIATKIYQGKGPLRKLAKNSLALFKPGAIDQRPMVAIQALKSPQFQEEQMDVFFGATTVIYVLVHHMGVSTPLFSTGICSQNMALTAHAIGLGTCYAGFGVEPVNMSKKLKKKLGVEWPYDLVAAALVVGYPAVQIDKPTEREFPPVDWIG